MFAVIKLHCGDEGDNQHLINLLATNGYGDIQFGDDDSAEMVETEAAAVAAAGAGGQTANTREPQVEDQESGSDADDDVSYEESDSDADDDGESEDSSNLNDLLPPQCMPTAKGEVNGDLIGEMVVVDAGESQPHSRRSRKQKMFEWFVPKKFFSFDEVVGLFSRHVAVAPAASPKTAL